MDAETKQELRELRMLLQEGENDMLKLKDMVTLMQELEERCDQLQNEVDSMKNMMKEFALVLTEETVGDSACMELESKAKPFVCPVM
jgi:hypothetical protein